MSTEVRASAPGDDHAIRAVHLAAVRLRGGDGGAVHVALCRAFFMALALNDAELPAAGRADYAPAFADLE